MCHVLLPACQRPVERLEPGRRRSTLRPTASTSLLQERVDPEAQTWRSRYFYLFQDKDTERKFADYQVSPPPGVFAPCVWITLPSLGQPNCITR